MTNASDFLTPTTAARLLSVHVNTIKNWVKSGKLPAQKLDYHTTIIRRSDVDRFLVPEGSRCGEAIDGDHRWVKTVRCTFCGARGK